MKPIPRKSTPVSRHFCQLDNSVISWLGNNSPNKYMTDIRRMKELYYIWAAYTVFPSGINQYIELVTLMYNLVPVLHLVLVIFQLTVIPKTC